MKGKQPVEQFFNCSLVSHYSAKACFKRHLNLISYNSQNKKATRIPKAGVCYTNSFLTETIIFDTRHFCLDFTCVKNNFHELCKK